MRIPASVDEVTAAWLSEALGADIRSVEVVDAHLSFFHAASAASLPGV